MKNKKNVILGAGESGCGAAVLSKIKGYSTFVSDAGSIDNKYKKILKKYDIDYEENRHSIEKILNAHQIIKRPGNPDNVDIILKAKNKKIPVISEIEFASRYTNAPKICITGSNGKTTTALLIYHILKKGGLNVGLSGNIGNSLAYQVATTNFDYHVIEISSFQLDGITDFKAEIALLLNITPDHLDRYDNKFNSYVNSKFKIVNNQDENSSFIYCYDDLEIKNEVDKRDFISKKYQFSQKCQEITNGAYLLNDEIIFTNQNKKIMSMNINDLSIQGKHNVYNSMAAGIVANILTIRKETIRESLMDFKNVEHRLENVISVHGIKFINDSKATNVNSAWYALESTNSPIIWIAGGVDKGNDYSLLTDIIEKKVKAIICLGKNNSMIHKAFEGKVDRIIDTQSMVEAVKTAYYLGKNGDTVLLSPACASFDLFEDYEDRGHQFKKAVRNL